MSQSLFTLIIDARRISGAVSDRQRCDIQSLAIEDHAQAQKWMDEQLKADWPQLLNAIADQLNPVHQQIFPITTPNR